MPLTTTDDVHLILEVPSEVTDASLQAFIDDADIIVTEVLEPLGVLSQARLTAIEKYIAAHIALVYTERGGLISSKLADAADQYLNLGTRTNQDRNGLQLTRYGQQALMFDTTGTLLAMSKQMLPARFTVLQPVHGPSGHVDITDDWWWWW